MKTCVCCIIKQENLYLRDWVEYYINLGFDNIILYDNNDLEGEYPHQVIGDYISNGFIIYKDVRGKHRYQLEAYSECYREHCNEYDWMAFFDADEFLTFTEDKTISDFLKRECFREDCDLINLFWDNYGDNGLLHYDKRPVYERFIKSNGPSEISNNFKLLVRCDTNKFSDVIFEDANYFKFVYYENPIFKLSDGNELVKSVWQSFTYGYGYIRHYNTYTIEEFLYRRFGRRGYADKDSSFNKGVIMGIFYSLNEMTDEKKKIIDDFFEKFVFEEDNVVK